MQIYFNKLLNVTFGPANALSSLEFLSFNLFTEEFLQFPFPFLLFIILEIFVLFATN